MVEMWSEKTEGDFFFQAKKFATADKLFYKTPNNQYFAYWPKSYKGKKTTLQSRNALIGDYTEKWSVDLLNNFARDHNLYAIQGVICREMGLTNKSPADVALCKTNSVIQTPKNIKLIIEVKMSIVWNWELLIENNKETLSCIGDFTSHKGTPGLLRSDSMLKAIGKSINIRVSGFESSKIPIIILGNTPITKSYEKKVDHLKQCGIIQGFWSINPKPRMGVSTIKYTREKGFLRMDSYDELIENLDVLLGQELAFFSSMKSKRQLGEIIAIADKEKELEKKAEKFLELIRV